LRWNNQAQKKEANREETLKKAIIPAFILLILAGIVVYAYFRQSQPVGGPGGGRGPQNFPVEVTPVAKSDIIQMVSVTGTVAARAEVEVYPKQAGELVALLVDKGAKVKAGQILGRIEPTQFETQVKQAQAELASAKAAYEKNASMAFVNSETAFKQAKSELERLQATLKQAEVELELQASQTETQVKKAASDLRVAEARLEAVVSGARSQEIEQVRVRAENAKREFDRLTALLKDEIISQEQVEAAQLQYEIYSAQLSLLEEGARPEDIEVLKAQVEAAKASLQAAEDSKMQIDIKRANLESAKAQVANAQAAFEEAVAAKEALTWEKELAQAEAAMLRAQATLELAQRYLDDTVIRAPISGVVSQRLLDQGDMASPARPFATIVDMDVVKIAAKVPGRDLAAIRTGAGAVIKPDAYPGEIFSGTVVYISPVIDRASQTGDIEIEIPNSDHKLKPGMFTRVELRVAEHKDVIVIPVDVLVKEGESTFVYTVNDGVAHKKPVVTGVSDGVRTEILSGLEVDEMLVVAGQYSLIDGASVTVKSEEAD
jgi:RND family efflux transporter MFP subunit